MRQGEALRRNCCSVLEIFGVALLLDDAGLLGT